MTSRPAVDVSSVQIGTIKLDVCGWMDDALPWRATVMEGCMMMTTVLCSGTMMVVLRGHYDVLMIQATHVISCSDAALGWASWRAPHPPGEERPAR